MEHVAIMKKQWNLIEKILLGEKTIETRWYLHRVRPWNCIKRGETIYFKDTGSPVIAKAEVKEVEQFSGLDDLKRKEILNRYGEKDLGTKNISNEIDSYISGKKYAIIIFLTNPQKVKPFDINKNGFGAMSAWLCVNNIEDIKI